MTKNEMQLAGALTATGMIQPVQTFSKGNRIDILCRQMPGQDKRWVDAMEAMLRAFATTNCSQKGGDLLICRRYLINEDRFVSGIFVSLTAKGAKALDEAIQALSGVLTGFRPSLHSVHEIASQGPAVKPIPHSSGEVKDEFANDPDVKMAKMQSHTTALPRTPEYSGPDPVQPGTNVPEVKVVLNEVTPDGKRVLVKEMPLPHVYKEMNIPTPGGRGATRIGGK